MPNEDPPQTEPTAQTALPSIRAGTRISHYEIVGELGRGGMGVVYRALDLRLGHHVALKCPRRDSRLNDSQIRRIIREARTTAKISHPYIVPLLDVFEHEGLPLLVMELVDGSSLRQLLVAGRPLPIAEALKYSQEILEALGTAHSRNVLHRDVTPNNILIGKDGHARLTDFGLAYLLLPPDELSEATTASMGGESRERIAGTPGYIAPERILGKPGDHRADLFSVGVVMHEMCAGEPAFRASEQGGIIDAIMHRETAPLSRLNYEVPEELERIVRKALSKKVDERYQTHSDMLADVRALRRRFESGSLDSAPAVTPPRKKLRRLWISAAAVVLVAAAIAIWFLWPRPPAPLPESVSTRVSADPGWESEPAISPQGDTIAYSSNRSGNADIWIVDAVGGEPLQRTTDAAGDRSPAWYPDGSTMVFVSDRGGTDSIWKLPRLGGAPTLLIPDAFDPAISPDGMRIAFAHRDEGGFARIAVAELDNPAGHTVLTGNDDGLWDHYRPAWSPDGKTICYSDFRDLWVVPAAGGEAERLTVEHGTDRDAVWSPDGSHVYFSSMRESTIILWRVHVKSGRAERVTQGAGPASQPSLSTDGRRLAFSTFTKNPDLVLVDLETGRSARIHGLETEALPAFFPDRSRIVFTSRRGGEFDLWVQDLVDGRPDGIPRRLSDQAGTESVPTVSPDGKWLAYSRVLNQERDVWIMPAAGGLPLRFSDHPSVDMQPAWSPDGTRLAFVSDRSGRQQIWVAEVKSGQRISEALHLDSGDAPVSFPRWSPNGSRIAYLADHDGTEEVWIVEVDGDRPARRLTSGADARCVRWTADSESLWINGSWGNDRLEIRHLRLADGQAMPRSRAVVMPDGPAAGIFDVSADGRFIVHVIEEEPTGDVWLMEAVSGSY